MENKKVKQYMSVRPLYLTADMSLAAALDQFITSQHIGGPVVNEQREVIGFISEQDLIKSLLGVSYHCQDTHVVADVMKTEVLTVTPDDAIVDLAQTMTENKPKIYPVVEGGKLVGIITRRNVLQAISESIGHCFKHPV
ncbi:MULTISPECIES: CBS domain-containing protein [Aliivibrio]|uniref:CBS domain containing protein n=2 Tax=Aliivibrio fischeri TaxID=668 RepID=B5FES1_ALIFM|nr:MULTISPECIES: CBS domain-containing protein [Aliivibrio]ACH65851.1 CBS domain containing protein [Aliivibrio fischeri MJ11]EHN69958.1 hypothetical protein VFSR5_1594 [Aliivibrio fischeri SR5]MBD1569610.1 CBS domain-containing protein [Aliivibrio sp. S10_S31]MCE4934654.1 CBS domain-containing protein [Aliivibrio fischeri]MUH98382.1 CBS domain-containing protein [Aliivibrio fischeri]